MDEDTLRSGITTLLAEHTVMSLATLYQGRPHAANVMYAPDGLAVHWFSASSSRHSRALAADPRTTATVAAQFDDFGAIRGLQLHGEAQPLSDPAAREHGLHSLAGRFPFLEQFRGGAGALAQSLKQAAVYRLEPTEITLIDNRRGFGFKQTLRIG